MRQVEVRRSKFTALLFLVGYALWCFGILVLVGCIVLGARELGDEYFEDGVEMAQGVGEMWSRRSYFMKTGWGRMAGRLPCYIYLLHGAAGLRNSTHSLREDDTIVSKDSKDRVDGLFRNPVCCRKEKETEQTWVQSKSTRGLCCVYVFSPDSLQQQRYENRADKIHCMAGQRLRLRLLQIAYHHSYKYHHIRTVDVSGYHPSRPS